jgi:polysaccharide deacetylase family protein (PEP-CTERM system associated)
MSQTVIQSTYKGNILTNQPIINGLTIDVEDYFMVSAFENVVKFEDWHSFESRIEMNTYKILELLDEYRAKATFFVLGWVAEHHPNIVRDIHSSGHEVSSHGYKHRLVYNLPPEQFREDVRKSKQILEDITGEPVIGFRAASYSIVGETLWALDILIEEGFLYDSSIFPVHHDRYGFPEAYRFPHIIKRNKGIIIEFPPTTYQVLGVNIPIAGGGYLRLFPIQFIRAAIRRINENEKNPVILYFHPWEIDVEQPRLNGRRLSKIRHYININSTMPKLETLLSELEFGPLSEILHF